jgi:lipid II:glycine glycyltransferase (peptidoglycan interpeptide bridge formation enzyme)
MTRVELLRPRDRAAWDGLVAASPAAGFMQSWAWSTFKELEGYVALRLGLFDGDRLAGGAIAYAYPSPLEAGLLVIPDGPVLDWAAPAAGAAFRALVAAARRSAPGRSAIAVRVEPRLPADARPAPLAGLARAPVDLVPDETLLVDLGPEAEMLGRMRPKGRYNARLALRRGVEVVSSTDPAGVDELYFVLAQTARYQDFRLEPRSFFINLAQALVPELGRLVFARYRGITLAAALVLRHGATATYLYGGHLGLFRDVMANYALHWHVMREAARDGFRTYDLYGYVPADRAGHPYARFSRFKEKLGGRHVARIGSRDVLFYDRLAGVAVQALRAAARGRRRALALGG